METIVNIENLSIGYIHNQLRDVVAKNISFSLQKGQLTALVGANGIGKSTLLKNLSRIEKPFTGNILLFGKGLDSYKLPELSRLMSVVWANNQIMANLSVYDLVALGRHPYTNWIGVLTKKDAKAIDSALTLTHCQDIIHKKCYEISDGQLQKVLIAKSLAQETPFILLDEPTTHLDIYHKAYILKLLKTLAHETGKTILFSTHEIDLAIQLCDQIVLMKPNKTIAGAPCELIQNREFASMFPKDLIGFDEKTGRFVVKG
ncbi:MAG: ABC transporter ATP-binding protein [Flavobacteriales bacterium CG_4_9_14_3_um_filter_40_17]|nr:MAG: ABC transporter ATP-binding protein [Flavobacteriales bacterium CG_4_9_14_3_um_filter_40_17]